MDEEDDGSEEHPQQVAGPAGDAEEPGGKIMNNDAGDQHNNTVSPREFVAWITTVFELS